MDSGAAAASGDRDGLRRARVARASVSRTLWNAHPDDRAAALTRAGAVRTYALGTEDESRTEDSRNAHDKGGAADGDRRRIGDDGSAGAGERVAVGADV